MKHNRTMERRSNVLGTVYLIHFHKKFHHCKHYIGWTENPDIKVRFEKHKTGQGSRLLRAVMLAGIKFRVVRTWENVDRNFERKLKKRKNSACLCPICTKKKAPVSIGASLEASQGQGLEPRQSSL